MPTLATSGAVTTTTVEVATTEPPTTISTVASTTTAPQIFAPPESREEFLAQLDARGWATYTDPVAGWSIRYPSEWTVASAEAGASLDLETPLSDIADTKPEHFGVFLAQDALSGEDSFDYLVRNIDQAFAAGQLRIPEGEDFLWYYLDHDFDGAETPSEDLYWTFAFWAIDVADGSPLPEGSAATTFWYGYYDSDLEPDYGYIMQTVGFSSSDLQPDDVALSFEPPVN